MEGLSVLLPQLEEVLRTQALSAMAVYEQGIYNTQDKLDQCLQELQRAQAAAEEQCSWQVQQIQEQYQQSLDALTAQYEEQVRQLEQQTKERISAVHAEAEDVVTQAAAQLLFSLQPQDPEAAAATEELSLLHIQEQQQLRQDVAWGDQQDREQHLHEAAWHSQQQQQQQQQRPEPADSTASFAFVSDAPDTSTAAGGQAGSTRQEAYAEQARYLDEGIPHEQQQRYQHSGHAGTPASMHADDEAQQLLPNQAHQAQEQQCWQQGEQEQHVDQWQGYQQRQQQEEQQPVMLQPAASQHHQQDSTADAWAQQGQNAAANAGKPHRSCSKHVSGDRDSRFWDAEHLQAVAGSQQTFRDDGRDNGGFLADAAPAVAHAYEQQQQQWQEEEEERQEWQLRQLLLQQQQDRVPREPSKRRARSAAGHVSGSFSAPGSTVASRRSSTSQGQGPSAAGAAHHSRHEMQQQPMLMRALSATEVLRKASSSRQQIEQGLVQGLKRASQASIPDSMLAVAAAAATAVAPPSLQQRRSSGGYGASPIRSVSLQGSRRAPAANSILSAGQHSSVGRAAGILPSTAVQRSISSRESRSSGSSMLNGAKKATKVLDLLDDESGSD